MTTIYKSTSAASRRDDITRANSTSSLVSSRTSDNELAEFWSAEEVELYQRWQSSYLGYKDAYANPYFDQFFSGQDIQVSIDGLPDTDILPIFSFGYMIEQQKQPVYGFWNYTYDAVLRGTRIITGAFTLVSDGPITLTKMIAKAADVRASRVSQPSRYRNINSIRGLDDDEANINQYWFRNYDNNLESRQQHLFSVHPPFNFKIKYGVQETSTVLSDPARRVEEVRAKYNNNSMMYSDYNERLVKNPSKQQDYTVLLENVELVNKSVQYDTDGNPILETYSFMARDERLLSSQVYDHKKASIVSAGGGSIPHYM